jgi:hypothetical protein
MMSTGMTLSLCGSPKFRMGHCNKKKFVCAVHLVELGTDRMQTCHIQGDAWSSVIEQSNNAGYAAVSEPNFFGIDIIPVYSSRPK